MAPPEPDSSFPGTLYAGDSLRLAGAGPEMFTSQMDAGLPFKALIHGGPAAAGDDALALEDCVWMLPEHLSPPGALPTPLLYQLASIVRTGGKVGLASTDELVCNQVRDVLLLVLEEPKGSALRE